MAFSRTPFFKNFTAETAERAEKILKTQRSLAFSAVE